VTAVKQVEYLDILYQQCETILKIYIGFTSLFLKITPLFWNYSCYLLFPKLESVEK